MSDNKQQDSAIAENPLQKKLKFLDKIWEHKEDENRIVVRLKKLARIIWAATARFKDDGDLMRAGSIAFQIVVSAIPLFVLGLFILDTIADVKTYEAIAKEYTRKNNLPIDISIYFNLFYSLLENKGALTGIGVLIVIFSATSILKKMEEAMNRVWGVKKPRPILIRMAFFVMVIVMGPFLIAIGIRSGQNLVSHFASPDLQAIRLIQDKTIVVGDKHVYIERAFGGDWKYKNILDSIDFDAQRSVVVLDGYKNKRVQGDDLLPFKDRIRKAEYSVTSKSSFKDVAGVGDRIFIVTNTGSIITSRDRGETWTIRNYQVVEDNVLIPARFNKIRMWNSANGTIIGDRGLILTTSNGGDNWNPVFVPGYREDLNDVDAVAPGKYLAVGQNFSSLVSEDSGVSWRKYENFLSLDEFGNRFNLNGIVKKGRSIYVVGDSGTILYSKNEGLNWDKKDIGMKNIDFHDLAFLDENTGILIGEDGQIRYTLDGGYNWSRSYANTRENLRSVHFDEVEQKLIIVGSNYKLLANQIMGGSASEAGNLEEFRVIKSSPLWRIAISFVGNFFIPFILIWAVFFLLYKGLPNANVEFRSAMIGSTITAVLWVLFLVGFQYYAVYFLNKKFALYGALAAIPLLLLLINLSVMIVLYGTEIAYLVQNPAMTEVTYKQRVLHRIEQHQIWWGVSILRKIFDSYESGKSSVEEKDLLRVCHHDEVEFLRLVQLFQKKGWIGKLEDGTWTPTVASSHISMQDLIVSISPSGYDIEDYSEKDGFKKKLYSLFRDLEKIRDERLGDLTLQSFLKK